MCLVSTFLATPPFSISRNRYDVINEIVGTHPKSNFLLKEIIQVNYRKKSFNDHNILYKMITKLWNLQKKFL